MELNPLVANRILHLVVLTALAVVLVTLFHDLPQTQRLLIAGSPLVTWVMGQQYERAIVLESDLIDRDDLAELERRGSSILSWNWKH